MPLQLALRQSYFERRLVLRNYKPEVDSNDSIPLLLGHGGEGLVAEDTGVGDKNMDSAEGV